MPYIQFRKSLVYDVQFNKFYGAKRFLKSHAAIEITQIDTCKAAPDMSEITFT